MSIDFPITFISCGINATVNLLHRPATFFPAFQGPVHLPDMLFHRETGMILNTS